MFVLTSVAHALLHVKPPVRLAVIVYSCCCTSRQPGPSSLDLFLRSFCINKVKSHGGQSWWGSRRVEGTLLVNCLNQVHQDCFRSLSLGTLSCRWFCWGLPDAGTKALCSMAGGCAQGRLTRLSNGGIGSAFCQALLAATPSIDCSNPHLTWS